MLADLVGTASFQPVLERLAASISARTFAMLNQSDCHFCRLQQLLVAAGVALVEVPVIVVK